VAVFVTCGGLIDYSEQTMNKHTELTKAIIEHADNVLAQLQTIGERLDALAALPRAAASIWEREGKAGTTYYLVHKKSSPRLRHDIPRRERIGSGDEAKRECEEQIQHQEEYQRLLNERALLSKQYDDTIYALRKIIDSLAE